jgi:hypothetical protein
METIDIKEPLLTCLGKFSGAEGETVEDREKSLEEPFRAIATKLIHGGYFAVSDKDGVKYRIYIHSVEFYYHEEEEGDSRVCDWIMYHRNPLYGKKKEAFPTGSLYPHYSGIDITFEDQQDKAEKVRYRASALIRSFQVTTGDNENMVDFERPKHIVSGSEDVEYYPTHLPEYFLNKTQLPAIHIEWVPKDPCVGKVYVGRRINVFKYKYFKDEKGRAHVKKMEGVPDLRKWAFCKEEITVQLDKQEPFTFE